MGMWEGSWVSYLKMTRVVRSRYQSINNTPRRVHTAQLQAPIFICKLSYGVLCIVFNCYVLIYTIYANSVHIPQHLKYCEDANISQYNIQNLLLLLKLYNCMLHPINQANQISCKL